jgi:hypothetical protein
MTFKTCRNHSLCDFLGPNRRRPSHCVRGLGVVAVLVECATVRIGDVSRFSFSNFVKIILASSRIVNGVFPRTKVSEVALNESILVKARS